MSQTPDALAEFNGVKPKKLLADEEEMVVKSKTRCVALTVMLFRCTILTRNHFFLQQVRVQDKADYGPLLLVRPCLEALNDHLMAT